MTIWNKLLIAVLFAVGCTAASAQGNMDLRACKSDVCGSFFVIHANGVANTRTEAEANKVRIQQAYGNNYNGHALNYGLAYNPTQGMPEDVYDFILQTLASMAGATWSKLYNAVMSSVYTAGMTQANEMTVAKKVDAAFGFIQPTPYQDADLTSMVNDVRTLTQWHLGARIVFVCHSQGNLYCRLMYPKLIAAGFAASSMGFVGMAVPDYMVPTGNTYVTSSNDLVIRLVSLVINSTPNLQKILAPNVTVPYSFSTDPLGHGVRETYMPDPAARGKVYSGITSEFKTLKTGIKLGTANTGTSKFGGAASWADCTGIPPFGDMSKWPNQWPAARDLNTCSYGGNAFTSPPAYYVPMVWYRVAGQTSAIARPGDPGEVPGLAIAHRDGCIAAAASFWSTYVASGFNSAAIAGTYGNCVNAYGGSSYKIELATRSRDLNSGDYKTSWTKTWTAASLGIGPYAEGGTEVYTGPACNN